MFAGKYTYFKVFYNGNEFYIFQQKLYFLLINYQPRIVDILTAIFTLNC